MNLADFHFLRPLWLLGFLPYGIVIFLLLRSKLQANIWSAVCDAQLLPYLLRDKTSKQNHPHLFTGALAALLSLIALAGPTWQRLPAPVFRNSSAVVIVLSLSASMDAEDIKPSRLIRARYKIADLLAQRKDGQSALVVYAGDTLTVTPLTDDIKTIDSQLPALTTDIVPKQGSNTRRALRKAVELFKQAGLQRGHIILVCDSIDDNSRDIVSENASHYSLSVLGVGTSDGAPIALPDGGFLKDDNGAIVMPKLNTSDLASLAQVGNGIYQTIAADDSDVQALLAQVNAQVEQSENQSDSQLDQWDDKGAWLLLAVLPLAALSFRKGLLCVALLLMLPLPKNSYAFDWQDLWQTPNQQAQHAYQQQQFSQAAEKFTDSAWKSAAQYKAKQYDKAAQTLDERLKSGQASSDDYYNQGNALAQMGKLPEAIKAYQQALQSNPNHADAKYNQDIVEKELQKQQQQQEQKNQQPQDDKQQPKDEQSGEQKQQDQQTDDAKNAEKPEQSEEKNADSLKNQPEKSAEQAEKEKAAEKAKAEQAKQAEQQKQEKAQEKPAQAVSEETQPLTEQQQADEQWLKRIPDDPAGLLKRKFRHQYEQRDQ